MNRTVLRAFEILQIVAKKPDGVTLQEVADELGIPKSSAFVIVQTLLSEGYIQTTRYNDKKYCLGLNLFTLGMQYVDDLNLVDQCTHYLNPLAEKYRKTAFIGILDGDSIVYINKYISKGAVLTSCALGSRHLAYTTALGKAIIAFSEAPVRERLLKQASEDPSCDYESIKTEVLATQVRGYAVNIQKDYVHNTLCCAAPVFDFSGKVIAAISLTDVQEGPYEPMGEELKAAAMDISVLLGYKKNNR